MNSNKVHQEPPQRREEISPEQQKQPEPPSEAGEKHQRIKSFIMIFVVGGLLIAIAFALARRAHNESNVVNFRLESLTLDNFNFTKPGIEGANWNMVFSLKTKDPHTKTTFSFHQVGASVTVKYTGMPVGRVESFAVTSTVNGTSSKKISATLRSTELVALDYLIPGIIQEVLRGSGKNVVFDVVMSGWISFTNSRNVTTDDTRMMSVYCEHVAVLFLSDAAPATTRTYECYLSQ